MPGARGADRGWARPATASELIAQLGVISRAQLLALAWRADQVDGAVRHGRIEVVHRGVYRVLAGGRPPGQAAMAAILHLGRGSRLTGAGVLAHHRFETVADDRVGSVLVAPPRRPRGSPVPWLRDAAPDHHHARLGPVPGTTVNRALVEVAAHWSARRWLAAFDRGRWRRLASTAGVLDVVERLGNRHLGVQQVRRLIAAGDLVQESPGERDLAEALRAIGFAATEVRWQAQLSSRHRVDAFLPAHRVVLEYDGHDVHTDPRDRAADRARDAELMALGHQVVRLRAEDVRDLGRLRERLDRAIASAGRHLHP